MIGLIGGIGLVLIVWGASGRPAGRTARSVGGGRTADLIAQAGLAGLTPARLLALQAGAGLLVLLVVQVLTRSVAVSAIFALFALGAPRLLVARLRHRRQSDLRELWPEVVDNLTSGVRAGLSLPEALAAIGDRGPDQLREPFRRFGAEYRTSGQFNRCLDSLKESLADPVGDRVCESLRVAREVGGTDLGRLLQTLSGFLREDARTRAELLSRQSWSVNGARLAVVAPWAVLLLLATQRETLAAYDTPAGLMILAGGAVLTVVAYRLMMRIGRLPDEKRVLR